MHNSFWKKESFWKKVLIIIISVLMLLIAFLSMLITIVVAYLAALISASLGKRLRDSVFNKVLSFSPSEFKNFSTASLITRSTNDIAQIQNLAVMLLRVVFYAPIMAIGGIFMVLSTNTKMTWIIAVAVALILFIVMLLFIFAMPKFKLLQKLIDKINLVSRETLSGLSVIKAFGKEKHEEERFEKANTDLMKTNLFINRTMSIMMPLMMLVMNLITVTIVWVGADHINNGNMQVGDMMAFMQYTIEIVMSFLMISLVSVILPRALVSLNRINEVITTKNIILDPKNPKKFDINKKGIVEFKNVSFRYPEANSDVITDINFIAKPGETTALIGSTGSGKSTVVNLIPRFFDVTEGEILVDGINIRDVTMHNLREKLGFNGLVITDATPMVGFCCAMERKDAVPQAIVAGCDMFLFNKDYDEDYKFMMDAYNNKTLTEERLEEERKKKEEEEKKKGGKEKKREERAEG